MYLFLFVFLLRAGVIWFFLNVRVCVCVSVCVFLKSYLLHCACMDSLVGRVFLMFFFSFTLQGSNTYFMVVVRTPPTNMIVLFRFIYFLLLPFTVEDNFKFGNRCMMSGMEQMVKTLSVGE